MTLHVHGWSTHLDALGHIATDRVGYGRRARSDVFDESGALVRGTVVAELRRCGVLFEEYDLPGLRTVDGIAVLSNVGRAAWFRDSEGSILAVSEFLVEAAGH